MRSFDNRSFSRLPERIRLRDGDAIDRDIEILRLEQFERRLLLLGCEFIRVAFRPAKVAFLNATFGAKDDNI